MVFFAIFDLFDFDCTKELSLVGEPSDSGLVREDMVVQAIALVLARVLVYGDAAEDDFVSGLFVVWTVVLALDLDLVFFKLLNDLLNRKLEEAFKREDLLGDKTILFEVAIDDLPAIVLVDRVHVGSYGSIQLGIHFQPMDLF